MAKLVMLLSLIHILCQEFYILVPLPRGLPRGLLVWLGREFLKITFSELDIDVQEIRQLLDDSSSIDKNNKRVIDPESQV